MSTVVKRKIRIKKKNFTIFTILVIITFFGTIKCMTFVCKNLTETKKEPEKVEQKNTPQKKDPTEKEKKLAILDNINKEIDYFNEEYLDRYIAYKNKNSELPNEQIIKNVNMNLDLIPYKDITMAKKLNTKEILVNKYYYLDENYVPENLEKIKSSYALSGMKLVDYAKDAFEEMSKAAAEEKLNIIAMSAYRSYDYQVDLYNRYKKADGEAKADTYSGRPGHSEHQTGLAVDVYNKKLNYTSFEKTKEFDWMQQHAHEYGFILRFPKDKENETGYEYESWHYRYVGKEIASYIKEHNISYEEYYATKIKDW